MATSTFNLERFRNTLLSSTSLARTNRFEVFINTPPGVSAESARLASMYVEQSSFPILNIATKSQRIFGPAYQRPQYIEYGGEGIPITFHVDRDMQVKQFFVDWCHKIINPYSFEAGYQNEYATTINIKQLNELDQVTYEIELLEAFPRNLNLMELNNASTNQTHRLTVLFAYRYWRTPEQTTPVDIPRVVTNPQVPREEVTIPEVRGRQWNWPTGELLENTQGSDLPPAA